MAILETFEEIAMFVSSATLFMSSFILLKINWSRNGCFCCYRQSTPGVVERALRGQNNNTINAIAHGMLIAGICNFFVLFPR